MRTLVVTTPDLDALRPDASASANAARLAHLALASYRDDSHGSIRGLETHFPTRRWLQSDSLRAFAAGNDVNAIIAIRGSSEEREWTRGLRFGHREEAYGAVHEGFAELLDSVWDYLLAALYDVQATDRHLWLTGHSAGGAMALIAAARLEHAGFDVAGVATYGAPPVFDARSNKHLRAPVYRVSNAEDPVPSLAWPNLLKSYVHTGDPIRLTRTGRIAENRHSDHLADRLDRVNELFEGPAKSGMRHDHSMLEYVRKLDALHR